MSKNLKYPLESRADGEGKLVRRRNIKSASFHATCDSKIYTLEYYPMKSQGIEYRVDGVDGPQEMEIN